MIENKSKISEDFSKELLTALYQLDSHLGKLDEICSSVQDRAVKAEFIEALSGVIGDIYAKLMRPIYKQHPVLGSPDQPGPWLKR